MLTNIIVLTILCFAAYVVKKKKEDILRWLNQECTEKKSNIEEVVWFWKQICTNPIRAVCLVVIFVCHNSVWTMLLTIVILAGISYFLAKMDILQKIDWNDAEVQKTANTVSIVLGIWWGIDSVGLLKVISSAFMTFCMIIGLMIIAVLFHNHRRK